MNPVLSFIIPIRHPQNSRDWGLEIKNLRDTVASIAAQTHPGWRAIIVANEGAALPDLPPHFQVERVDFPPNPQHERGSASLEVFYDRVRLDKGRRILAGLLQAKDSGFVMVVDDDDFVSRKLTEFASTRPAANGWVVRNGFVWDDGGSILYRHADFSALCGSSHIVRTDLYRIPSQAEDASETYIKQMLGSHRFIEAHLAETGTPLENLPFPGAIYRVGHSPSHSKSSRILPGFVFNRRNLLRPHAVARHLARLRVLSSAIRDEFFGTGHAAKMA